ncbi:MAG: ATP-binding cassette domain-containing protein [Lachnospiraceae bacterium]|nr:ATP-binding cassette domain-containing protein [Lachnospiraceae bacterium]
MIEFQDICKSYRVARRESGIGNAVKSLFKREYNTIHAINHISFSINDGEMIGLLGPNGAGKSSTIKILSGILTPDSGTCLVNGQVPWKNRKAYVRQIGVVFGQRSQLWWDVPVMDSFELLQAIYSIPAPRYRNRLDELTQLLHLEDLLKTPTRQLSLGQRMRCEIAASLLHEPRLLFLDEPTIGLDAVSKVAVRGFIKKMNEEHKTTVILTTHDMQDIEAITKRVILIGKGQKLLDGTLEDLRLEAASAESETESSETDIDHMIARLYEKLNIM